ncbi:MAG: hypothetical protein EA397_15875 [Deltaproteobacteria bacterium]|nr:MAG: hypothetical protein EA397_15875 [Deltaproteobacteria bacterium]
MRRYRRGNAITNVGIIIGGLMFSALVIDLAWSWAHVARVQYLNDAVATAAASRIDGTDEGIAAAYIAAEEVMRTNDYFGRSAYESLYGSSVELEFAIYEPPESEEGSTLPRAAFDESFLFPIDLGTASEDDVALINTVRVTSSDNAISPFFATAMFGAGDMAAASRSTAVWGRDGAGSTSCYIPMTVPDCYFTGDQLNDYAQQDFVIRNNNRNNCPASKDECDESETDELAEDFAGTRRMGWGYLEGNTGAAYLTGVIQGGCDNDLAKVGDPIGLDNGIKQSTLSALDAELSSSTTTFDPLMNPPPAGVNNETKTFEAPIFVFNGGPEFCSEGGAQWNGTYEITGIAWGVVYDVQTTGNAHSRYAAIRLDFARWHDMGLDGGGPNYGVRSLGITQLVE